MRPGPCQSLLTAPSPPLPGRFVLHPRPQIPTSKLLSAKPDGKGGTLPLTSKEMDELRKPIGAPGYAAAKSELKPGHIVELQLVRPRDIAADKAKDEDIVIKYAMIEGETKPPATKDAPKKKPEKP